ncbi:hypothetical protein DAPPUDRAFT_313180 [Daphnia pulex]|uniref:Beta-amyloid-like protein n=1 Tax=Daphnia pulex TaxID=6669 RepID=E9G336_DAPPU|nr:hypothetical protein DAPPUDRAFT_313180 [Daphnia pulex]|eukprot:EFX86398.1 hypothetical protein DAPPUDRAFT_313180 [Daphnia pulex]
MWNLKVFFIAIVLSAISVTDIFAYVEAVAGSFGSDVAPIKVEPQVAVVCDLRNPLHPQYMDSTGKWVSDLENKSYCLKDKIEILDFCRKVYRGRNITNIVEAPRSVKIDNWCKLGHRKCKTTQSVKPYRCLGAFQSEALLVPEQCVFDHVHNASRCWSYDEWNATAATACSARDLKLRSFAILLPCGVDLFSGVEFVCCPRAATLDDVSPPKPSPTPDPYLTHYNPKKERDDFLDAEQRLEERHRERVTKIMKDWSELEDRYQDLHSTDAKGAEEFKHKMTNRFQKLVKSMEDEDVMEKRQLSAVHQQRVLAAINEKKRDAMTCYTDALNENPANTHRIQKCLEKLLRALHKDRHHSISHFRHLLNINPSQAQREKDATIQHLNDIERLTNQSLQMLDRFPDIQAKVVPLMKDYLLALRSKDDTPSPLLMTSRTSEEDVLDSFKAEIVAKQAEKERQRQADKARKEDERRRDERKKMESKNKKQNQLDSSAEDTVKDDSSAKLDMTTSTASPKPNKAMGDKMKPKMIKEEIVKKDKMKEKKAKEDLPPYVDAQAVQHMQERPKVAHAQNHQIAHNEAGFSVRHESGHRENRSVYFTLAFAGVALLAAMVVGLVLLKRRHARSPHQQGFIEVDQTVTPEERHVANMQINGYENPTYKYFEAKE